MSKFFSDKDSLLRIILDVRTELIESNEGLKRIFKLLLSLHGSIGVINGQLVYNPDRLAYLNYIDRSSSIIVMSEGNGEQLSRSMRMAILEDQQEWEIRIGEQICSQVNFAIQTFDVNTRSMYLEQMVSGLPVRKIYRKYQISARKYYTKIKQVKGNIIREFSLSSRFREEMYQKEIKKYTDTLPDNKLKKLCQEQQEIYFEKIKWEKQL